MGPCNCNLRKIGKRALPALVILVSALGYAAPVPQPGQPGRSASGRLNISVVVIPVLQTRKSVTPSATKDNAVSYNFEATRREYRYEVRKLPVDKTSGSDLVHAAVLQTSTIVPE